MSSTSPSSPPKRPRLSLQIRAAANCSTGRTSRCIAAAVDVKSPTAFNTLSNVYATAVDRSTPVQENPPTAILGRRPMLRLQTQGVTGKDRSTPTPYRGPYLDTPITAQPVSPAVAQQICLPSAAMTATPPLSAQPPEQTGTQVFTFDGATPATAVSEAPRAPPPATQHPKRRTSMPTGTTKLPYTHPRSLRSILRNSPLPPLSTRSPESPRRQSLRLQEKAARRVAYNSPLTQEITTSKYTKSHIDLLAEDATPISPSTSSSDDGDSSLDLAMADAASGNTRDGGQTPGPFEEMRRRMANMPASTPMALSPTGGGIRKRAGKRREKKRRWVWTIGQDEEGEESESAATSGAAEPVEMEPPMSVPVLAVPAPRPRTRNQQAQAQLAKAVAEATRAQQKVPLLTVPVPPATRAATAAAPNSAPAVLLPPAMAPQPRQQQPRQEPRQQQPQPQPQRARELTPIPSSLLPTRHSTPESCSSSVRHITPEPMHHLGTSGVLIEPPTPSVESTTSASASSVHSRDSVFDNDHRTAGADVEMSDTSSFASEDDEPEGGVYEKREHATGYHSHSFAGNGDVDDVEMDEGTPTMTARPVSDMRCGGRGWVPWRDVPGGGPVS